MERLTSFHIDPPSFLLHGLCPFSNGKAVADDPGVNAWHIRGASGKYVEVLGEELDHPVLLVRR